MYYNILIYVFSKNKEYDWCVPADSELEVIRYLENIYGHIKVLKIGIDDGNDNK